MYIECCRMWLCSCVFVCAWNDGPNDIVLNMLPYLEYLPLNGIKFLCVKGIFTKTTLFSTFQTWWKINSSLLISVSINAKRDKMQNRWDITIKPNENIHATVMKSLSTQKPNVKIQKTKKKTKIKPNKWIMMSTQTQSIHFNRNFWKISSSPFKLNTWYACICLSN